MGNRLYREQKNQQLVAVRPNGQDDAPQFKLDIDDVRAGALGVLLADVNSWYVSNKNGEIVPFSAFSTARWQYGSPRLERYNGIPSVEIQGQAAASFIQPLNETLAKWLNVVLIVWQEKAVPLFSCP